MAIQWACYILDIYIVYSIILFLIVVEKIYYTTNYKFELIFGTMSRAEVMHSSFLWICYKNIFGRLLWSFPLQFLIPLNKMLWTDVNQIPYPN